MSAIMAVGLISSGQSLSAMADEGDNGGNNAAPYVAGNDDGSKDITASLEQEQQVPADGPDTNDDTFESTGGKSRGDFDKDTDAADKEAQSYCADKKDGGRPLPFTPSCPKAEPGKPAAPALSPVVLGRRAVANLHLPAPGPQIGPDPAVNKWKMQAVGYPLWLWVDGADRFTSSASIQGQSVQLSAVRTQVVFGMGDGHTVTCTAASVYVPGQVLPGMPSPDCGYVYQRASRADGAFKVTAVAYWQVTWQTMGQSGTITVTTGASRRLPIGELEAVLVP